MSISTSNTSNYRSSTGIIISSCSKITNITSCFPKYWQLIFLCRKGYAKERFLICMVGYVQLIACLLTLTKKAKLLGKQWKIQKR